MDGVLNADRHPSFYATDNSKISQVAPRFSPSSSDNSVRIIHINRTPACEKVIPSYQHRLNHALHPA